MNGAPPAFMIRIQNAAVHNYMPQTYDVKENYASDLNLDDDRLYLSLVLSL